MRESDIEELATHGGPEPCAVVCEGGGEASVGARAGRAIEPRNLLVRGADAVLQAEGNIAGGVFASRWRTPRGRRTWACAESPDARTGRSHDHPFVLMVGRVARGRPRP
jgi:hypothetical protein